jgi:IclR family transcriptional regulator, acetate operon repressor
MVKNAPPSYPVSSADNVVRVLLMLQHAETLRVTTVANDLGVSHSTAHRLLAVLVHRGLIEHDERRRTYRRGAALAALAAAVLRNDSLAQRAKPTLDSLAEQLDETVHLTILKASRVMFVAVAEGSRAVRAADRTGTTLPAHRAAAGKAILAATLAQHVGHVLLVRPDRYVAGVCRPDAAASLADWFERALGRSRATPSTDTACSEAAHADIHDRTLKG